MVDIRHLSLLALAGFLVVVDMPAVAESDAIIRSVPAPVVETPDTEAIEPLDLSPPSPVPTLRQLQKLKQVRVPLPIPVARTNPGSADPAETTADAAPVDAATPALSTSGRISAPPIRSNLTIPEAPKPDFAPKTASLPSFAISPSRNPGIPPTPGAGAGQIMQSPPGSRGVEDEEEEGASPPPSSVETQTDVVDVTCLKPELLDLIRQTGNFFKQIPVITSGYRSRGRAGSLHRRCLAADFIVPDVSQQQLVTFLRHLPGAGGVGTYCHTKAVHLDIGEPRDWGYCGFRRTYFSMR